MISGDQGDGARIIQMSQGCDRRIERLKVSLLEENSSHDVVGFLRKAIRWVLYRLAELRQHVDASRSHQWLARFHPLGCLFEYIPRSSPTQCVYRLPGGLVLIIALQGFSEARVDVGGSQTNAILTELTSACRG